MFSYNTYDNYEYTPANEKIILAAVKREWRTSRDVARDLGLFPPSAIEVPREQQQHSHHCSRSDHLFPYNNRPLRVQFCEQIHQNI